MIRALLLIVGLLVAGAAVYPTWQGAEANEDMHKWKNEITKLESAKLGGKLRGGDLEIEKAQERVEDKTIVRNLWFVVAVETLILGVGLAVLPSSRKRKHGSGVGASARTPPMSESEDIVTPLRDDPENRESIRVDRSGPTA